MLIATYSSPILIPTEANHQHKAKQNYQPFTMPTIMNSLLSRIFRSRKHVGEDDKSTTSGSTPVSKRPTGRRLWHHSQKHLDGDHRSNPPSFSSCSSYHSAFRYPLEQSQRENFACPEQECLEREYSTRDHIIPVEGSPIERKNSLEQELAAEGSFDWASLELELKEGLAEDTARHADRLPYDLSVNKSTPVLRRKSSVKDLHDLYIKSGPFRGQYLDERPSPPPPEPFLAFPSTLHTSPPDNRPTGHQLASVFDMIFDVAVRRGEPGLDPESISDLLSETATRLRREKGVRDPSGESSARPESSASLMSFGSGQNPLSYRSPFRERVPKLESLASPLSRGSPSDPFSQRRSSARRTPIPETPVSPIVDGAPISSLSRKPPSQEILPIPEILVNPLSDGSPVDHFSYRPSSQGEMPKPETPISPLPSGPPVSLLSSRQPSIRAIPRLEIPASHLPCSSPVKPLSLGPWKLRKRLHTTVRLEPGESLDGEPEPSNPWAIFEAVCPQIWE